MATLEKPKKSSRLELVLILVILFMMLCIFYLVLTPNLFSKQEQSQAGGSSISYNRLYNGGETVSVVVDEKSFDEYVHAAVIKDYFGMLELVNQGRVFSVKSGTRIQVLDRGFGKTKVRILEGEWIGASGWVPYEWVVK